MTGAVLTPDSKQAPGAALSRLPKADRLAGFSIPLACFVFLLKYWAYYLTDSVALYSDALECVINIIAAAAAFWAISVSSKPADHNHPFGHYKAEYFSAVFEGILIILAAGLIIYEAWQTLRSPMQELSAPWAGLAINLFAGLINAAWAYILIFQGRKHRSPALEADGHHLVSDVVTSAGVVVGLSAAMLTGWTILDPLLALCVAVQILWQGWRVLYNSAQGLMDVGLNDKETAQIRQIISAHAAGALEAHDLRSRVAGRLTFIEFHLVVPSSMTVGEAHKICDRLEQALQQELGYAHIIIHVEPEAEAKLHKDKTKLSHDKTVPIA